MNDNAEPVKAAQVQPEAISQDVIIDAYNQMFTANFFGTLVILGIGFLALLYYLISYFVFGRLNSTDPPLLLTLMIAGALGASFSALTRLYSFSDLPKVLLNPKFKLPTRQLLMYSLTPPIIGAIAALILYLLFAGDLISGGLFPKEGCHPTDAKCENFGSLLNTYGPTDAVNFAKAIVWAFIAGFAERLVPNTMDTLSKAVEKINPSA